MPHEDMGVLARDQGHHARDLPQPPEIQLPLQAMAQDAPASASSPG